MPLFISNSKKLRAKVQLCLLTGSFALIFLGVLSLNFSIPLSARSKEHYSGVVLDQQQTLFQSQGLQNRVLLIGGSSIGFSVSAENLTERLGMLVLNLGVVAGMGYSNIWNNYRDYTDPDKDIIVLSPEYELLYIKDNVSPSQCNLIFLSKSLLSLLENPGCWPFILSDLSKDLRYHYVNSENTSDVYFRSAYNEFGDMVSHLGKPNRVFNAKTGALPRRVRNEDVEQYKLFVQREIIEKGYRVVVIPTIIPDSACTPHLERIKEIFNNLDQLNSNRYGTNETHTPIYCLPDDLFFDTAYHLNQTGRQIKTDIFAEHLKAVLGNSD